MPPESSLVESDVSADTNTEDDGDPCAFNSWARMAGECERQEMMLINTKMFIIPLLFARQLFAWKVLMRRCLLILLLLNSIVISAFGHGIVVPAAVAVITHDKGE